VRASLLAVGFGAVLAGLCIGAVPRADAQDSTATRPWYEVISVNGFVSSSYSYNFNRPLFPVNGYRVFDFDDKSFKVDVAELVLQKPTPNPGDAGFRVDVAAGGSIPRVTAAAGLFRDAFGGGLDIDLQQAYVGYLANAGRGLKLELGKFVTHFGYEVIEGYDGWNDNVTRSILFGYAIPFTHTGFRATYPFSNHVSSTVMLVNGWDDATDRNQQKSAGAQLSIMPTAALTVILNGMYGPERADNSRDPRRMLDLVVIWKPAGRVALGLNLDHGRERNGAGPGQEARWDGAAAYVRVGLSEKFSLIGRAEQFGDWDGARTGLDQRLSEITLTPEFRPARGFVVRGDLRLDHSDHEVFEKHGAPRKDQRTAIASVLFAF
jgi:hypothetical protein